ncbi:Sulfotransferase domain [Trinorchestia longiramus]|nr:Sulfotransferase domain [Trinorchestia longiramus]
MPIDCPCTCSLVASFTAWRAITTLVELKSTLQHPVRHRVWRICTRRLGRRSLATAASLCLMWGLAITVMPLALTPKVSLPLEAQPAVRRIHQQQDSDYSNTKLVREEVLRGTGPDQSQGSGLHERHTFLNQMKGMVALPMGHASIMNASEVPAKIKANPLELNAVNTIASEKHPSMEESPSFNVIGKSEAFAPIFPKIGPKKNTGDVGTRIEKLNESHLPEVVLANEKNDRKGLGGAAEANEGPYTLPILKTPKDSKLPAPQKSVGYMAKVGASADARRPAGQVEETDARDEAASHVVPFRGARGVYSGVGGVFPIHPVEFQHKGGMMNELDKDLAQAKTAEETAQMLAMAAIMHGKKVTDIQKQLVSQLSPTKRRKLELKTKDLQQRQEKAYLKQLRERGQVVGMEGGGEKIVSSPRTSVRLPAMLKRSQPEHWPDDYKIFLNVTFSPWVDEKCKSLVTRFAHPHTLLTQALASFPSSGNTWLRFLIEGATGIYTGSVYDDSSLSKKGMYGEGVPYDCGMTIMQKTHGYTTGDGMKVPHEQQLLKNHFMELGCRGLVIIRNPFKALISHRHLDIGGHTGFAPKSHFVGEGWDYFVALKIQLWENFYTDWLEQCPSSDVFVTHYEILKLNVRSELAEILHFFHLPVDEHRLECLLSHSDASFKRRESRSKQYSGILFYPWHLKCLIYSAIDRLNFVLVQKNKRELPNDQYEWYNSTEANIARQKGCPKESNIHVP